MMKYLMLALLATISTTANAAQSYTLYKGGYWQTLGASSNDQGHPMCTMVTKGDQKLFYVKWTQENGMIIQLYKSSWKITPGAKVSFNLELFDNERPGDSATLKTDNGWMTSLKGVPGASIFMGIENEVMGDFIKAFSDADKIVISFPNGDEPSWNAKMDGSRKAANEFKRCMYIIQQGKSATQPTQTQPTQPVKPKPTQPAFDKEML